MSVFRKKTYLTAIRLCVSIILVSLCLTACDKNYPDFDLSKIGQQQQPFGIDSVDIKINEVQSDGQIITRFEYSKGLFAGCRKYLKYYGFPAEYGIYTLFRKKGLPVRYEKKTADFDPDILWISDELRTRSITTYEPTSDSTWRIFDRHLVDNQQITRTFSFGPGGLLNSEHVIVKYPEVTWYNLHYQRDRGGNIISSWKESQASPKSDVTDYEYDNNPNPFFKLGVDFAGDESIISKSPNNIIREVIHGTDGQDKVVSYTYRYNARGYPVQVLRKSKEPASNEQVDIYDFFYK